MTSDKKGSGQAFLLIHVGGHSLADGHISLVRLKYAVTKVFSYWSKAQSKNLFLVEVVWN